MRIDRRLAAVLTAIGLALVVVGSFLPWFRSGRRARSSYELFDLVDRLDLLSDGMARVAIAGWLLVPLAAAGAVAALLLGRTTVGAVISIVVGLYTAVLASVVRSTAGRWEAGTAMATIGGIVATVGGLVLLASTRRLRTNAGGHHMSNDLPEPGAQLPAPDPGAGSTPPASPPSTPASAAASSAAPPVAAPPPLPPVPPPPAPVPPPEAATVTIEPAPEVTLAADGAPPKGGSKGKIIAAVAAVVVLVAGVLVTVKLVSSRSEAGGAASPDEAVENMMGSLEENDLLGVLDMFAPWERDAAMGLIEDYVDNAQDAGYLADDTDLSNVGGYTLTVDGLEVRSTEVNERIVNVALVGGTAHLTTEFDELPLGAEALEQLEEATDGEDPENVDATGDFAEMELPPITTIEDDGRWYVSLFYTIAESARAADRRCPRPPRKVRCRRSGPTRPRKPSTR